ncbi:hypothetical protein [Paracoccus actinidiae]|uniref:hypothetical protein n=1 Tax=Paracoccus actinidiae TaxID=3064531 RepID=UPI0027D347AF|nr:hypothetical protein [Paracoccus sp. M09]
MTILRAEIDTTGAARSQPGRHMQALTHRRLPGVQRDAPSVRCLKPGHLGPAAPETTA